jgi:hypothetical protein
MGIAKVFLLTQLVSLAVAQEIALPRFLGNFSIKHPAYVQFHATEITDVDPLDKFSLLVSTFDPRTAGVISNLVN